MRKNAFNVALIVLASIGFMWSFWQHELLFTNTIPVMWETPFTFFWGVHVKWGFAYDFTALLFFICFIVPPIAVWYWKD
jgi:hypothetical protein